MTDTAQANGPNPFYGAKEYEGTKKLLAAPMTRGAYNSYRGWTTPADEDPNDEGRIVMYLDGGKPNHPDHVGYISWSPADVFEKAYHPCETHVDRMRIELEQLQGRLAKLHAFMAANPAFTAMRAMEQELMRIQLSTMETYHSTLNARLALAELAAKTAEEPEPERAQDGSAEPALTVSEGGGQTV